MTTRNRKLTSLIVTTLIAVPTFSLATTWSYLANLPADDSSICQHIKSGKALLVVGADGCTETAPWAGYLNFSPIPSLYKQSNVSENMIHDALKAAGQGPNPSVTPNTGDSWLKSWGKTPYAGVSQVYVYITSSETPACGLASSGAGTWPDLFNGNQPAKHINFPWTLNAKIKNLGSCSK